MISVAAYTSGRRVPSARFRVRQHVAPLLARGVEVREYVPAIEKYARFPWRAGPASWPLQAAWEAVKIAERLGPVLASRRHQVTWLERELASGLFTLEGLLHKPMVLDVDDAIWLMRPFGPRVAARLARRADAVIAGNAYLADWFSSHCRAIHVIPTAVDVERFRPASPSPPQDRWVVGWIGTSSNHAYLKSIEAPLRSFLAQHEDAAFLVVSDAPAPLEGLPEGRASFLRWSEEVEAQALQRMHVGLMPLPDDAWTRGKCSFKMLQYMACGLPVVASPVGMNAELLATAELGLAAWSASQWSEALAALHADRSLAARLGAAGRRVAEERFARDLIADRLAAVFRSVS